MSVIHEREYEMVHANDFESYDLARLNSSVYQPVEQGERSSLHAWGKIYRYILPGSGRVDEAVIAIKNLLEDNSQLIFVSGSVNENILQQRVRACRHLVINGRAVCLTDKEKASDEAETDIKDVLFSEALIEDPVMCTQRHIFEKEFITNWVASTGGSCPYEEEGLHQVGALSVPRMVRMQIISRRQSYQYTRFIHTPERIVAEQMSARVRGLEEQMNTRVSELEETVGGLRGEAEEFNKQAEVIRRIMQDIFPYRALELVGDGGKIGSKTTVIVLKSGKYLPVVGSAFAVALAAIRVVHGQYFKALGEIVSGCATLIPVAGTSVSISIDGLLCMSDVHEISKISELANQGKSKTVFDEVKDAHKILGLNPEEKATREQVDVAFRNQFALLHSEGGLESDNRWLNRAMNDVRAVLNTAKEVLYAHYKWN